VTSTRREWLRLCAAAGASEIFLSASGGAEGLVPAKTVGDTPKGEYHGAVGEGG
jgi:hypothetical protein